MSHPNAFALPGLVPPAGGQSKLRSKDRNDAVVDPFAVPSQATAWNPFEASKVNQDDPFNVATPAKRNSVSMKDKTDIVNTSADRVSREEALAKARQDALQASAMFTEAMKEAEQSDGARRQSFADRTFSIDKDFLKQLEQRRREREAQEAAHAAELRLQFLEKKNAEDLARAQEIEEVNAQKLKEQEDLLKSKVFF